MRRAFFFSIDAFLAATILITGVLLITTSTTPEFDQGYDRITTQSQDIINALNTIRVKEIEDPWVHELIQNDTIRDPEATILYQAGAFWALNETDAARRLLNTTLKTLPKEQRFTLSYEDENLYGTLEDNNTLAAAKRMITGIARGEALEGSTGAAFLQQVSEKESSRYAYFGGFVGQGNITVRLDDLPDDINDTNTKMILLEGAIDGTFTTHFNTVQCGAQRSGSSQPLTISRHNLTACKDLLEPGNNTLTLEFESLESASVSGGFLKVAYTTSEFSEPTPSGTRVQYLPRIEGVINYYDGLTTPGTLTNLTLHLEYETEGGDRPIFFDVGNKTIYESNATGAVNVTLSDSYLKAILDYNALSNKTVPVRFGYYEGNATNTSGNITDAYLVTSRAGPMSLADIEGTSETRMEVAKRLGSDFASTVVGAQGNRLGLVSYFAGVNHDQSLTTDNQTLQDEIDGYRVQNPNQAQRDLCGAMEEARDRLVAAPQNRNRAVLLMTDGDTTKCSHQDAIDIACDYYDTTGITYYTVGFGADAAEDAAVRTMLEETAECTEGAFAQSKNATGLEDIYEEFADAIAQSSIVYGFQRITQAENILSTLSENSRFTQQYEGAVATPGPTQLGLTFQTPQFDTCDETITIPPQLEVTGARMISYSGDYWTKNVLVNETTVYNLTRWGSEYQLLGDPSRVEIPRSQLTGGDHRIRFSIGANESDNQGCSQNNTIIYEALLDTSVSRTGVKPLSEGCEWTLEFEDNTTQTIRIPQDYTGNKTCAYTSTSQSYDEDDSYDSVAYRLFDNLDFDDDGRIFINLKAADLQVNVALVSQVPYLWGPSTATVVVGG